jgi:septal ring factor EnvC (AmiA/AmiB activator)
MFGTGKEFSELVSKELEKARSKHKPMTSLHEGLAIIWEEFEELKAEVFKKEPDMNSLTKELVETATMCQRLYEDLDLAQTRL